MEFNILYFIQSLHNNLLDNAMLLIFNNFVGSKGEIWVVLSILLLIIPKTRKTGLCVLSAYIIAYFVGDVILKNLIARPRPCMIDKTIALLIKRPSSFSCPSVHSMLAFASASSIYRFNKKMGIAALVFAALIGFSRMYFFVHFPTDVLLGSILGFIIGTAVSFYSNNLGKKKKTKNNSTLINRIC